MAVTTITFSFPLNVSVDVGDTAYTAAVTSTVSGQSGTHLHSSQNDIVELGKITEVQPNLINGESFIIVDDGIVGSSTVLVNGDYIMFSKDNKVNLSTILGYYAKIKMINNLSGPGKAAELFNVGAEVTQSSK